MNLPALLLLGLLCGTLATAATRESFNSDWRFDRFGPMPDGSVRPEPGQASWSILATADSEEADRGNRAECAMDGRPDTRWCAAGGGLGHWLRLDLGRPQRVTRAQLTWEFPDIIYGAEITGSVDGQTWKPLPAEARYLRFVVNDLAPAKWASIREVELFGEGDRPIVNQRVAASAAPNSAAFDDTGWRRLAVPHDWGIEGPFRHDLDNNTGKLPWKGIGWYRKHFTLPAEAAGQRVFLDFDGAMANAEVWLNGQPVGGWPYGYQGFRVELTPHLKFGDGDNVVAVRLDTVHWGSRWYPGAGLYRNVWLVRAAPIHFAHWGVRITTPELTDARGTVQVVAELQNQATAPAQAMLQVELFDPAGQPVANAKSTSVSLAAGSVSSVDSVLSVATPQRWDLATPRLYKARTTLLVDGRAVDMQETPFGFRTLAFTARDGFQLNGRRVEINGTCNHHDLGPLGGALNLRALHRQLVLLKEMGCNALRTTHNPPAPELLDLADRMGFLVQVEAFDCWRAGKTADDYSRIFDAWHARDLRAMVRHFANHPSVFMWSIGNEIHEQHGPGLARELADIVRAEDPTRPVTAGCNNSAAGYNGFQTAVDVFGLNYNYPHYARFQAHPGNERKPIHASESSSCISSRGEYFFPVARGDAARVNFQVSSYDVDAPGWACPPDEEFRALDQQRAVLGEFVWTGFDYLGEPTPYNSDASNLLNFSDPAERAKMKAELDRLGRLEVPSRSSYFGILDLAGFPKDRFYAYQARWRPDLPMAHLLPHWTWPERVGQVTPVHCYTSGDEAELFLNGKSLGRKKKAAGEYRLRWDDVVYAPGELKVQAFRNGKPWATETAQTAGSATKLLAQADRPAFRADGSDLCFVTVTVADAAGRLVPRSHHPLTFTLAGPGEIVAVCNGDAASFEPFQATQIKAFNGLALVIVKGRPGSAGTLQLHATTPGLAPADVTMATKN